MKVLLDTSVCIAIMRGRQQAVARLARSAHGDCVISTVAMYELFTGIAKCREPERESSKVQRLLSALHVAPFDEAAAEFAAQVRADLEKTGKVCGPYDLLLAGHALSLGLILATNNVEEFSRIDGLRVEDWVA